MNGREPPLVRNNAAQDQRRNLVFTSAGDRSNLWRWLNGRRNFDLWISYYGDEPGRYAELADFYNARRGAKFGNLKFVYDTWPRWLTPYHAVFVADDDVHLSADDISRLFEIREEHDLWLLQPAASPLGKISWAITRPQWGCSLRFTNFVEMTCPLFRKDKLDAFIKVFDPVLTGTGTDFWFIESLGDSIERKVAVVDAITYVNPWDRTKGRVRECDRLQTEAERTAAWNVVRRKYGVATHPHHEFGRISKPAPARWLSPIAHAPIDLYARLRRMAVSAKRSLMARR